mgnify:CR=1 FL=1|jgi:predicted GNAT family N-acyltransferase
MEFRFEYVGDSEGLAASRNIRVAVFVKEQGIPRELELDETDYNATHVLVYSGDTPVATGRLSVDEETGIIARIAVLPAYRGMGLGRRVVGMLEEQARRRKLEAVELSPHHYLERFYAELGYVRIPGTEEVAGHRLIRMRKNLS